MFLMFNLLKGDAFSIRGFDNPDKAKKSTCNRHSGLQPICHLTVYTPPWTPNPQSDIILYITIPWSGRTLHIQPPLHYTGDDGKAHKWNKSRVKSDR